MCGGPRTQAEYMSRVNDTESRYALLGTYYDVAGQKAIMVTDGDLTVEEYVYNVYSADGRDYKLNTSYEEGKTTRELAAERMIARGFTYAENPTAIMTRRARPKRKPRLTRSEVMAPDSEPTEHQARINAVAAKMNIPLHAAAEFIDAVASEIIEFEKAAV